MDDLSLYLIGFVGLYVIHGLKQISGYLIGHVLSNNGLVGCDKPMIVKWCSYSNSRQILVHVMENGRYHMALYILGKDEEKMIAVVVFEGVEWVRLVVRECVVHLSQ